ncbi:hypothetical protein KEM56_005230 [Ascosphaera pollenicola]|nr:hypothetical protein KEM56_005230 [Ascosphaera pollenicola]
MSLLADRSTGVALGPVPLTYNEALSGIFGSISMTCWFFLMVPQLIENYKLQSADALSLSFLLIWFLGDVANLVGSVWANLVPVVVAIAFYFFLADFVLIGQCIYYNVKNSRKSAAARPRASSHISNAASTSEPDPTTPLLSRRMSENLDSANYRRGSRRESQVDDTVIEMFKASEPSNAWMQNVYVLLAIAAVGTAGWWTAWQSGLWKPTPVNLPQDKPVETPFGASVLGYISSVCYLGARLPQIYKNFREKSCDGLSLLFFIMSVMGNVTYGFGVITIDRSYPQRNQMLTLEQILCHSIERNYVITNLPWLIGSLGTITEDAIIFFQFRLYAQQAITSEATA